MRTPNTVLRYVDAISLLVKAKEAARTTKELVDLVGMNPQSLRHLLTAMHAEGLVERTRAQDKGRHFKWRWVA